VRRRVDDDGRTRASLDLPPTTLANMAETVWTAAELEQLSPAEQDAIFEAGIVRDLSDVPPAFLARVRRRLDEHIANTGSPAQ